MALKILFCTPYKQSPEFIQGGIAVWGFNMIEYSKQNDDVKLLPISFDRKTFANRISNPLRRLYCGVKELSASVMSAKEMMKLNKVDAIHICTSASYGLLKDIILLMYAHKYGIRSIVHFHFGRIPSILSTGGWECFLLKKTISMCNIAITMNNSSYSALLGAGFQNVVNIPNPLSTNIVNKIKSLEGKYKRIPNRLLYVGHVYKEKGVWELVRACRDIPDIELHIVGRISPEVKEELNDIAGNSDRLWCYFDGEISHDDVLKEFQKADLFIFPSYSEGFPNVILEAMASGCPIASSNAGAIPEMLNIGKEECGVCFLPKSVNEVQNAIIQLQSNPLLKHELADRAYSRVHELYIMSKVWEMLVSVWKGC